MKGTQELYFLAAKGLSYVAVLGAALAGLIVLLSAVWRTAAAGLNLSTGLIGSKATVYELIRVIDLYLIATVFYIVSVGLFQLFIDQNITVPEWMRITSVDDLKNEMLRLAVVVLTIDFLGEVVGWSGDASILPLGAAIALVIAAVSIFLKVSASSGH